MQATELQWVTKRILKSLNLNFIYTFFQLKSVSPISVPIETVSDYSPITILKTALLRTLCVTENMSHGL